MMTSLRMARVYICGPFRAKPDPQNQWVQHQNIERANTLCFAAWEMGAAGFCPHTNTRNFQGALPDAIYLQGDLAWLEVADAVLVTEDWSRSVGAREEVRLALAWGIPVFRYPGTLAAWLNRTRLTFSRPMPPPNEPNVSEAAAFSVISGRIEVEHFPVAHV
jgi:hypothetical protein